MGRLSACVLFVSGCYSPVVQPGAPCVDDGDCPATLRCVSRVCGGTEMTMEDAAIDSPSIDAPMIDGAKPPMMVTYTISDPADIRDTWLWSANPTVSYGGNAQGSVDAQDNESSLFYFDLSAIPQNATVVSAKFRIRSDDTNDPDGGTVNAYVILQSWTEAGASYLSRNGNQTWAMPCAQPPSRATTVIGTFSPAAVQTDYTVTLQNAAVQQWVTSPGSNNGFILARGTSIKHLHFHMKESANPPRLTVDALVPQN